MKPIIKIGEWVALTEDGIWFSSGSFNDCSYKSKGKVIEDLSCSYSDSRKTPKVKRLFSGEYCYYPKDSESGRLCEPITVRKVTESNVDYLNEMFNEQWENDPLSEYD